MLKTVKYSFVGRKSIFFLFLNYVFSYCKHCYVSIYQNYTLLIIPFLSHLSLILLSICNLLRKTPQKHKNAFQRFLFLFLRSKLDFLKFFPVFQENLGFYLKILIFSQTTNSLERCQFQFIQFFFVPIIFRNRMYIILLYIYNI